MIKTVEDIRDLLLSGFSSWHEFGHVKVVENGDYVLFNYGNKAMYEARWTPFEQLSRGLIIHRKTGEFIARPFEKFFNWGEGGRRNNGRIREVVEKMDGVLGILYRDPEGNHRVATRGSFDSPPALWATEFLQRYDLSELPNEYTLMFEILHPEHRIVVDYGGKKDLVLIGVRNRYTGEDLFYEDMKKVAEQFGFSVPRLYAFASVEEIISEAEKLGHNHEGWIIRFDDGSRFKIKGPEYLRVHRLMFGLSDRRFMQLWYTGDLANLLEELPKDTRERYEVMRDAIEEEIFARYEKLLMKYRSAPDHESKKNFAIWAKKTHPEDAEALLVIHSGLNIFQHLMKEVFGVQVKHLTPSPYLQAVNEKSREEALSMDLTRVVS